MKKTVVEIRSPQHYTMKEIILISLILAPLSLLAGVLLCVGALGTISVLLVEDSALAIPVALRVTPPIALCLSFLLLYFLPAVIMGNLFIKSIVRRYARTEASNSCVCQLATTPMLVRGARAFLEDADDIGVLTLGDDSVSFTGDRVNLYIPYSSIVSLSRHNVGWRGLWFLYGDRIRVSIEGGLDYASFEFAERQSNTVPSSKRLTNRIYSALHDAIQAG